MADIDLFEQRFIRAYRRYLVDAPAQVDATGVAHGLAAGSRSRAFGWVWVSAQSRALVWAALVVLTILALLAALVVGSRRGPLVLTVVPAPAGGPPVVSAGATDDAWALSQSTLWHRMDATWTRSDQPPGWLRTVHASADGTLWAITWGSGSRTIYRRDTDAWSPVPGPASLGEAPDGSILIAQAGVAVKSYTKNAQAWTQQELTSPLQALSGCMSGAAVGGDDSVWVGSEGQCEFEPGHGGLARFHDGTWDLVAPANQASEFRVYWLAAAPDGSVWVAGQDGTTLDSATASDAGAPQPRRWLARFDGDHWKVFDTPLSPVMNQPYAMAVDGSILVASDDGLARFDGATSSSVAVGAPVFSVDVARDGTVWISGLFGVARIDGLSSAPVAIPLVLPPAPP